MNYIYFAGENSWQRYNLETDEFEEGEPPLPSDYDIEFSKEVEEKIFHYIKEE